MTSYKKKPSIVEQYDKKHINLLPDLYFKKKRRVRLVFLMSLVIAAAIVSFIIQVNYVYQDLQATEMKKCQYNCCN